MKLAEVVEIYLPATRDVGWVRARGRWGKLSTFALDRRVLRDMANDVLAKPERRPVIDPKRATIDDRFADAWPPAATASIWLVRESLEEGTRWRPHPRL